MKFKLFKHPYVVHKWIYKCPKCKSIDRYDFEKCMWTFEHTGLHFTCSSCGFDELISKEDIEQATIIKSKKQFDVLVEKKRGE